jgi:thioesterase domain-containing protein
VPSTDSLSAELEATWYAEIPLAAAMAIEVASYADGELRVRAPLASNRNLHGTAFAGSLFSVCVLTGWGKVWLALRERDLRGSIVVAESRITYRKAVSGEILCSCRADAAIENAALAELEGSGRTTLMLACTVDGGGAPAVRFEGKYVVKQER